MQKKHVCFAMVLTGLLLAAAAYAQSNTGTTTLTVGVAAEASIVVNATPVLTTAGTVFNPYTGQTNFTYKIRTTKSGGTGAITLMVTSDFAGNGPKVATSGTTGNTLSYDCSVQTPAKGGGVTGCSTGQVASTTVQTPVASFVEDSRSDKAGNNGAVAWTLVNDPGYETGNYSAVVTFTISAS